MGAGLARRQWGRAVTGVDAGWLLVAWTIVSLLPAVVVGRRLSDHQAREAGQPSSRRPLPRRPHSDYALLFTPWTLSAWDGPSQAHKHSGGPRQGEGREPAGAHSEHAEVTS